MSTPGLSHPCNQTGIYAPRFPEGESLLVEIPTFILAEQEDGGQNCFPRTQLWSQALLEAAEENSPRSCSYKDCVASLSTKVFDTLLWVGSVAS